jgi:dihydropyrimidinase
MDVLIKNGTLVGPSGRGKRDIWIRDELVAGLSERPGEYRDSAFDEVYDAAGKLVLPGVIDAHTHYLLESRGTVTADGFYSGSLAGAFGGVTTAVDFADQREGRTLQQCSEERIEAQDSEMLIDYALHQSVFTLHDDLEEQLKELAAIGVTAVKIFTTYKREGYYLGDAGFRRLFRACRDLGITVTAHCEDDDVIEEIEREWKDEPHPPSLHPVIRPAEAEYRAVKTVGRIAGETGMPLYVVHLSSGRGIDAVRELRRSGVRLYVETTPHYLLLTNDLLSREDAQKYLMTPPLRTAEDNARLWEGIAGAEIEVIATDHCTFTPEQKFLSDDCRTILPGIPGTEELLPLVHTFGVKQGRISLERMTALLSEQPARAFGLYPRKGTLTVGSDADLVIFDPERRSVITDETRHTAAGYSPYSGTEVIGMPEATMVRGSFVVRDGHLTGRRGHGRFQPAGTGVLYED